MKHDETYDYVIVGAGSAGCVLAARLSENPQVRVLLLEAGGWDTDPWIHLPLGWGRIVPQRRHDWHYDSAPEPALNQREIECTRGKVIGGCSSINAMAYVRGNRADYDRWANTHKLKGWSYDEVLPWFKRQEHWEGGEDAYRGGSGPVGVIRSRFNDPLAQAFMDAGQRLGHPLTDDYNGEQQHGLSTLQMTLANGRRSSAAVAYLRPALRRPNLTVQVHALASRVVMAGGSAQGVSYAVSGGAERTAWAGREVILAGGVINSPQLLMLSGIGDPDELRAHGITPAVPLRGVGKNLQDHLWASVEYQRKQPGPFHRTMRLDRVAFSLAQALLLRTGPWTDLPSGWTGFLKTGASTGPSADIPDVQILFRAMAAGAGPYLPPFKPAYTDGFTARAVLLRPQSRGRLTLASPDPRVAPRIHFNFLSHPEDLPVLRTGLRMLREFGAQPSLASFVEQELSPGPHAQSDADLDAHIRAGSATAHHPIGTCKMGAADDPQAVVDDQLRVRGIAGLRVVDASVMPDEVGGNIQAAVLMIAERAAGMISGDHL